MLEAVGHPVERLRRSRYAGLGPGRLKPGDWRELTRDEVRRLRRSVGLDAGRTGRPSGRARR